jgi:DNA-binding LacI/PurR family transcriptional regulator
MAVTLKDVAERAGVSRSAVSRTFTAGASVSAKTRAKVEAAAKRLGYAPNALASSLTTGRTKLIGLIANNFHNPLILEVFDLFTRGCRTGALRPLLVNLSGATDTCRLAADAAAIFGGWGDRGLFDPAIQLCPGNQGREPARRACLRRKRLAPEVHVVGIDNMACGRMAAETLIRRGYRRVGFLGGPESATSTQDRAAGFVQALAAHPEIGVTLSYADDYTFDAGRAEMQRLLLATPGRGLFLRRRSSGGGRAERHPGLGPVGSGDIGLIGLNDMEMSRWQNIGLTTIRQPMAEIIDAAIELVVATIAIPPDMAPETRHLSLPGDRAAELRPLS